MLSLKDHHESVSLVNSKEYIKGSTSKASDPSLFFNDPGNASLLLDKKKIASSANTIDDRISTQTDKTNNILNTIYNDISQKAFTMNGYRLPAHGIPFPEKENPLNLFQRQLKIEEMSFELSHGKYKKTLESLIKMGRADSLAASHRVLIHWMGSLEVAISEQQRIALRKSKMGKNNPNLYML